MTVAALLLILASAVVHAGWNLLGKGTRVDFARFLVAGVAGSLMLTPLLLAYRERVAAIPPEVWALLVATSAFLTLYYAALARSYACGQFSTAYPIARALPLVLVTLWTCLVSGDWGRTPFLPFSLLVIGCCLLPLRSFSLAALRPARGDGVTWISWGWILLTAVSTAAYSAIDDHCMRALLARPGAGVGDAFVYCALEMWLTAAMQLGLILLRRDRVEVLSSAWSQRRVAIPIGCGVCVSYVLMLVAMPLTPHVGWTLAFRQASIPLGAIAGMLWLGEPATKPKLAGLAMIVGGLALAAR